MATRSRTRASVTGGVSKPQPGKVTQAAVKAEPSQSKPAEKAAGRRKKETVSVANADEDKCVTCTRQNDGSPMVFCSECNNWNHFVCVDLSERDAEDITLFICPPCSETSGLQSTMSWEGLDAFVEETGEVKQSKSQPRLKSRAKISTQPKPMSSDESEGSAGEDEYVGEQDDQPVKDRGKTSRKRRAEARESDSESDSTVGANRRKRTRRFTKASASPPPSRHHDIKRKASTVDSRSHAKKHKSESATAEGDSTRKYCLTKLEELFKDIFFRYPHVRRQTEEGSGVGTVETVPKTLDEMTEEEKDALLQASKAFADELEKCTFEGYAEVDKSTGQHISGTNYKERFRTLQFNLSKSDRVAIHRRITSATITPKELSGMSSTDLADEETKQEIKQAEQEALEHSILQKVVAPRAKITHKGLQDIEYNDEPAPTAAPSNDVQAQKEVEAEERRERERLARLKPVQRQRTMSFSVASETSSVPPTPTNDSWGAPPPVPVRDGPMSPSIRQSAAPLFTQATFDMAQDSPAPEMNLADLINIDEATPTEGTPTSFVASGSDIDPFSQSTSFSTQTIRLPPPSIATGISPFAYPVPAQQSFNLDTFWTSSKERQDEDDHQPPPVSATPPPLSPPTMKDDDFEGEDMVESPVEQEEQDFDMFLEEKETSNGQGLEVPSAGPTIEELPTVWTGKMSMPLEAGAIQEPPVVARQIAGTTLQPDSLLWKTLFPSDILRVEGRVAVESSGTYLTQMRMNSTKELYAVALSPASEADEKPFKALGDFLRHKQRHGLSFPWGQNPAPHCPGKELYLIPLEPKEELPVYIELLDNLQLPINRKQSYMIGIWVLNQGMLAPPPPGNVSSSHTSTSLPTIQPSPVNALMHSLSAQSPHAAGTPSFTPSVSLPSGLQNTPNTISPPLSAPPPPSTSAPIDPGVLANEVASLTPEQIQSVLRTLGNVSIPGLTPPAGHPPPPAASHLPSGYPPYMPSGPPPPPPHIHPGHGYPGHSAPWPGPSQPYHDQYPPTQGSYPHPPHSPYGGHNTPSGPDMHSRGPRPDERYDRGYGDRDGPGYGGGGRGRGRGQGRGRGKGRGGGGGGYGGEGGGYGYPSSPSADSGWPRKPKHLNGQPYDSDRHQW